MKLTEEERDFLLAGLEQLELHFDEREKTCREFKWICHDHLPQVDTEENGNAYSKNINVFEIQDKTVRDIKAKKERARIVIMNLINKSK